jgi:hypothetical protein
VRGDVIGIMRKCDKLTIFVHCLFTEKALKGGNQKRF